MSLVLYSHHGCPYVQRVAIVLAEKQIAHIRLDVDFGAKPAEFLAASPLAQVPALRVGGADLFDSIAICEYLEDRYEPRLHPPCAERRARHRGWMAFGTALLQDVGGYFKAEGLDGMESHRRAIVAKLSRLEQELTEPPFFAGRQFSLVDAVFAPVFRYFDAFATMEAFDFFDGLDRLQAWREALKQRPSVASAVPPDFASNLVAYLCAHHSALARKAGGLS